MKNIINVLFLLFSVISFSQITTTKTAQQLEADVFQQFRVLQQQEVDLFQQFNGRYDFTAIGNTLNTGPNSCNVLTESSAELNLDPTQTIISAHLYWSGSGGDAFSQFPGDYQVTLNGISINSQRNFLLSSSGGFDFFGGYADVTEIVANNGNGLYTLSDLDLTGNIYSGSPYCAPTLDYAGWSITIIYEDPALSFLNQINLYDGLEVVDGSSPSLEITLTDLDVGTDEFSKIGFLAWEGEENIAVNESLSINGILIDDPELNPGNNPFNSTNTYTESQEFWNMDLDVYDLENIISPGDTDIDVVLTSGQDLILVNNLITFVIPANASPPIPGTPAPLFLCDVFPNDGFAEFDLTLADSEIINGQAGVVVTYHLTIGEAQFDINPLLSPFTNTITDTQTIFARLENIADGLSDVVSLDLIVIATPAITDPIGDYNLCDNDQDGTEVFDLTSKNTEIENGLPNITLTYYNTETDANTETNTISTPATYNSAGAETIWLRAVNPDGCATLGSFNLIIDTVNNYIEIPVYEQFDDLVLDGFTAFYLESQSSIITGGNPALTVTYYETQADADLGTNALPSAYTNLSNPQIIYVRVEDNTTGCYVIFDMELLVITPPPSLDYTFCSEDTPLEFNPPLYASASILVSDTSADHPSDTGIIGTGLGEYRLESVVLNVQGEMAQDVAFYLQPTGTSIQWELGAFAGGTDGMDTAVDLVFTDTSVNNYALWTGGAPAADYYPQDGAFNTALAGLDINGEWYLIVQGTGIDTALVNSFCINWQMSSGDAPEIFCPADFTAENSVGVCGAVVNFAPPIALDTEDGLLDAANIEQTGGIETGGFFPVGDNNVTFTATDSHGNETSCSFIVTVLDSEIPEAICQDLTVILDDTGNASIVADQLNIGSNDNCGVESLAIDVDTFDCSNVGANQVTLTVTDIHGNTATCVSTVTVLDNTAPIAVCQDITLELGDDGTVTIDPLAIDGDSSDACGIASYELDIDTLDCSNLGNTTVILTVTDVNGNQSSCAATVTLEDNSAPVLVCNDVTVELNQDGVAFITPSLVADITDNCGTSVVTINVQEVSCADIGTPLTVTVFANDDNGNTASCSAVVTVVDLLAPEIVCPENEAVNLDPNGTYTLGDYIADGSATATDNCTDPVTIFTQDPAPGSVLGFGVHVITFTAEDEYGNVSTCSFELDVQEILGASDLEAFASLVLYPNPADNQVNLSNPTQMELSDVTIYDLTGRIIHKVDLTNMGSEIAIDVSTLANAPYLLVIKGSQGTSTKTLIVNN
jgi:hypothetical protein